MAASAPRCRRQDPHRPLCAPLPRRRPGGRCGRSARAQGGVGRRWRGTHRPRAALRPRAQPGPAAAPASAPAAPSRRALRGRAERPRLRLPGPAHRAAATNQQPRWRPTTGRWQQHTQPRGTAGSTWPAAIGSAAARLARHALPSANSAARVSARTAARPAPCGAGPSIGSCAVPTAPIAPCESRGASWERAPPAARGGAGTTSPRSPRAERRRARAWRHRPQPRPFRTFVGREYGSSGKLSVSK